MSPPNLDSRRSTSPDVQQPAPRRSSWMQRFRERVPAPVSSHFWQNFQSRNTTRPNLTTEQSLVRYSTPPNPHPSLPDNHISMSSIPLATRIVQMGRRLSTPLANYRPHTAPPNPNSMT